MMEPKVRWTLLLVALAVVAVLALRAPGPTSVSVVDASDARHTASTDGSNEPKVLALNPRVPTADTKALFATTSWAPSAPKAAPEPAPPPPTAPPLPFKFVGKQRVDEGWEVFLSRGDEMLIVREGQTIDESYKVESLIPPTMTLTYVPLGEQQQLRIGDAD